MFKKIFRCLVAIAAFLTLPAMAGQHVESKQHALGFTIGYEGWQDQATVLGMRLKNPREFEPDVGLVYRYTVSTTGGRFYGLQAQLEKSLTWVGDLMVRFGPDLIRSGGRASPYIAGGLTVEWNDRERFAGWKTYPHSFHGWKLAAGSDFALKEGVTAFLQAEYAEYNTRTVQRSDETPPAHIERGVWGIRFGLMQSF